MHFCYPRCPCAMHRCLCLCASCLAAVPIILALCARLLQSDFMNLIRCSRLWCTIVGFYCKSRFIQTINGQYACIILQKIPRIFMEHRGTNYSYCCSRYQIKPFCHFMSDVFKRVSIQREKIEPTTKLTTSNADYVVHACVTVDILFKKYSLWQTVSQGQMCLYSVL